MAKSPKEVILTDAQKDIKESLGAELSEQYVQAITIASKLKNGRSKLNIREANLLLNFFESNDFTDEQKNSLYFSPKEAIPFVKNVLKLHDASYAYRTATSPYITHDRNKALTKHIKKHDKYSLDYAVFNYSKSASRFADFPWCYDMVISPIKKDILGKNPSQASYMRIAEFIYKTNLPSELGGSFDPSLSYYVDEYYNFADRLFGRDDEIADKSLKTRTKLEQKKNEFIDALKNALIKLHETEQLAKQDSAEHTEFMSKTDDKLKGYINNIVMQQFNKIHKKEFDEVSSVIADMKKRHPKDYNKYVEKIRKTEAYQKAYAKYYKQFSEEKEKLTKNVAKTVRASMNAQARNEVLVKEVSKDVTNDAELEAKL